MEVGQGNDLGPIKVDFDLSDLMRASEIAELKVDLIDPRSPAGQYRNRDIRRRRLIAGKLADHAVRYVLERFMRKMAPGWSVLEYDEIRTDDFRDPDPWDLQCLAPNGASLLLEIRSSFVHWLRDHRALAQNRTQSLLGPYGTEAKRGEMPKDLFWQVAFFRVPIDVEGNAPNPRFYGDARDLPLSATIMGGGEASLFAEIGFVQPDIASGASYSVIRPMSSGRSVGQMLQLSVGKAIQ